jgi:hypothetical protein
LLARDKVLQGSHWHVFDNHAEVIQVQHQEFDDPIL